MKAVNQFDLTAEYHRTIEPTQLATPYEVYRNPYEVTSPYDIPLPPPPPKRGHTGLVVALMSVFCLITILASVLIATMRFSDPPQPQRSMQATVAKINAMQLYLVFRSHGLTNSDGVENDGEYQDQGVNNPEGGVVDFTGQGGVVDFTGALPTINYSISVFRTSTETDQAATTLFNGGDNGYMTKGFCMLHVGFASHASDSALSQLTTIMDTMCK